ncbi:MAG: S16 family serine protease [Fervidicoccaceae archaeon]
MRAFLPIFTVLLIFLIPVSAVASSPVIFHYDYLVSINLPALAVSSGGGGVVTNLTVTVAYPGSGQVYFSSDPVTQLDTQSSARIAVLVAASLLGIDYRKYDYFFSMKSPSLIIGGPSASAVMTVGVVAAILRANINSTVAMTGMINPDGTIGPVGGLSDKLQAAASAGYKTFLVPVGQLIETEQQIVSQSTPFGTIYRTVTRTVNLSQLGENLGVKVVQVTTLRDALSYFLENVSLPPQTPSNATYTLEQKQIFSDWRNSLLKIYNQSVGELAELSNKYASFIDQSIVQSYLNQSSLYIQSSNNLWSAGEYYSSLSSLYMADIAINAAIIYVKTTVDPNLIQTYINSVNSTLSSLKERIYNLSVNTFSQLESYLVAMDRLDNAQSALSAAAQSIYRVYDYSSGKWRVVLTDPLDLAVANLSQFTIQNWISYGDLPSPPVSGEYLKNIADYYLQYAKSVLTYYQSLASEVNVSTDLQTLNSMFNNAYNTYYSGSYPASLYYSVATVSRATLDTHLLFNTDLLSIVRAELANINSTLGRVGYVSAIVLGYSEQANNYLKNYLSTNNTNYLYSALTLALQAGIYETLLTLGQIYGGSTQVQPISTFTTQPTQTTTTTTPSNFTPTSSPSGSSPVSGDGYLFIILVITLFFIAVALYLTRKRAGNENVEKAAETS